MSVRSLIIWRLELIPNVALPQSLPCRSQVHLTFARLSAAEEGNGQGLARRSGRGSRRELWHTASRDPDTDGWCVFAPRTRRLWGSICMSPTPVIACHADGQPARTCGRCGPGDGSAAVVGACSWCVRSRCNRIRQAAAARSLRRAMLSDLASGACIEGQGLGWAHGS